MWVLWFQNVRNFTLASIERNAHSEFILLLWHGPLLKIGMTFYYKRTVTLKFWELSFPLCGGSGYEVRNWSQTIWRRKSGKLSKVEILKRYVWEMSKNSNYDYQMLIVTLSSISSKVSLAAYQSNLLLNAQGL